MSSLHIAILGAGPLGKTLGGKWAKEGHIIAFGVKQPSPERAQTLQEELGEHVSLGSPAEALATSDIVVLALPGDVVEETIATYAERLDHKIILDASNHFSDLEKSFAAKTWIQRGPLNSSHALQTYAPYAHVYRVFHSYAWEAFADPLYQGIQADLFYCGPEGEALTVVEQLIAEIGLRPMRLGDLDQAEAADTVFQLWVTLAFFKGMGRDNVALKVLTR